MRYFLITILLLTQNLAFADHEHLVGDNFLHTMLHVVMFLGPVCIIYLAYRIYKKRINTNDLD